MILIGMTQFIMNTNTIDIVYCHMPIAYCILPITYCILKFATLPGDTTDKPQRGRG